MKERTETGLKIILYVCVLIISSLLVFSISMPAWTSYYTSVAYHSYLAFLAIVAAGWSYSRIRQFPSTHHILIFSVLISRSIIHLGAAIDHLFEQSPLVLFETANRISSDLLEILFLSSIFFISAIIQYRNPYGVTTKKLAFPVTIAILAVDGLIYHILFPTYSDSLIQFLGLVFGVLSLLFTSMAGYLWIKNPEDSREYASIWILTSQIVFAVASLPLLISLVIPSTIWGLSMNLQATGFYAFAIAASKPIRLDIGLSEQTMIIIITSLSILIFIPFIISVIVVAWIPEFILVDFGAYLMSHIGSAMLSSVMAFLLYTYSKYKPERYFYPLIICLAIWAYADFHLVVLFQPEVNLRLGESLVPYIASSLITILNLILMFIWIINPPDSKIVNEKKWIIPRILVIVSVILMSSVIEIILISEFAILQGSPVGRSFLLSLNVLIPFLIINLGVIIVRRTKSLGNAEVIALAFLALRVIPNILKGNFDDWSAGWWAAEIVLLAGSLIGPAVFGALYLKSTLRAEQEKRRATLYSDLLVHDITNYHQAIQVTLDLLRYDQVSPSMRKQAIEDAFLSLKRADHLIRNVRHLGKGNEMEKPFTETIDLIACIKQAFNEVQLVSAPELVEFNLEAVEGQYYVNANTLLVDVFLNLFRNAIQYSPNVKKIEIKIQKLILEEKAFWQTHVTDYGQGIKPERKALLFQRYMQGSSGTGLGLSVVYALVESYGGQIHVEDRVKGDYTMGTVFILSIPAVN